MIAIAFLLSACTQRPPAPVPDSVVTGAMVWTGNDFTPSALAVHDGRIVDAEPGPGTEIVDATGQYIIPGLCDAHAHDIQSSWQLDATLASRAVAGVTAVKILSSVPEYTAEIRTRLAAADGVDVAFAGPPLTGPGGHPIALQHRLHGYGAYPDLSLEDLNGFAHVVLTAPADVEPALDRLVERGVDFVKIMLVDSEFHDVRVGQPAYFGRTGIDPLLVPTIVDAAHRRARPVSAHVNSLADFRVAVAAGVDEIAHLPGRSRPVLVSLADAEVAAAKGIVVVTTAALAERHIDDSARFAAVRDAQRRSLVNLVAAGVTLALGTDSHGALAAEANYLAGLGAVDNADIVAMATRSCAATTLPGRKLGSLLPGYEATYVVLAANPLDDIAALGDVVARVRRGQQADLVALAGLLAE